MFVRSDLQIIEQHVLPSGVTARVIQTIRAHALVPWIYRGQDWFIQDEGALHVAKEQLTVGFAPIVTANFESLLDGVVKVVGVSDDLEAVARCESDVRQAFGSQVSAARSQPYYLDVTHPDANKGHVVDWLSSFIGIPADKIATIGDQPSDVSMFVKSGLSIAMGNASKEVQQAAKRVTNSNEDEGFAQAIERFILGERQFGAQAQIDSTDSMPGHTHSKAGSY
jgi:Cof subfamily protein (haloacid dehalogenase superfamily)